MTLFKKIIAIILGVTLVSGITVGVVMASNKELIKDYFPNYQYNSSTDNYVSLEGISLDASKDDDMWKNINPYHQVSTAENRDTLKYSSYDNILKDCDVDVYTYLGEDGLFIYAETNDQIVNTYNTTVFGKSGLEFYICDASALTKLDHLYEYTIGADGFIKLRVRNKTITGTETYITNPCIGIERSAKLLPSGGYAIETFIPYETIGIASKPKEIHIGTAIIRNIDAVDTTNYIWELLGMNTNGVAPNNNTTFPIFDENGYRPFAVGENFGVVNSNIVDLTDDRGFHPVTKTYNRGTVAAFLDMDPVKNVYLETTVKIDDFNYTDDPRVGLILRGEKKSDGSFDQVYFMFELDKDAKTKYTIKDILMLPSNTKAGNDWTKSQKYLVDSKLNDSSFKLSVLKDDDAFYFYIDDVLLCKRSGIKQLLNSKVTPGIASWFTGATFSNYYVKTSNVTSCRNNKTELFIGDSNKTNINIDLTSEKEGYITTNTTANNQAIVNYMNPADSQFYTTLTIEDFEAYKYCNDGRVGYSFTTYYDGGYKRFFVLLRGNNETGYTNLDTYVVDNDDFGGTNWSGVKNIYSAKLKLDGKTNLDVYRNKNLLYLVINNNVIKCLDLKDTDVNKNMTVGLTAWKVKSKLSNYALYEGDDFPSINSGLVLNTNLFDNFKSIEKFELKDGKINIYQHVQAIAEKAATAKISDNATSTAYVSSNIKKPSNTSKTIDPRVGVMLESNPDVNGNKGRIQLLLEYEKGSTTPKSFVILPATYDATTAKWTSDWNNSKRINDLTNYLIKDTNKLSITKEGKEFKYYINDIEVKGLTGNIVNNLKYFGDTSKVSGLITSQYTDAVFSEMSFTDKLPVFENTIVVTPSNRVASENIYFELSSKLANCSGNLENMQGVALLSEDNLTAQNLLIKYNNLGNPIELLLVKATREALDKEWTYDFDNKITYSITSILDSDKFKLAMSKDGANVNLYINNNLIASRSDLFESDDKVVDATVEYNTTGEFDDQAYEEPDDVVEKYVANNNNKIVNIDFLQSNKIVANTTTNNQSSIYFYKDPTDKLMAKAHVKFNSVQSSANDGRVGIVLTDENGTSLFVALKGLTDGKITNIDSLEYKNDVIAPWLDAIKSLDSVNFAPNTNEADLAVLRNGNKLFVLANNSIVKTIDLSTAGWTMSGDTKVGFTSWKTNAEITNVELKTDLLTVTYNLDGGTNNPDNPDIFFAGEKVTLKDAIKNGYVFDGWYKENTFTTKVTEINSNESVVLYAKFSNSYNSTNESADGKTTKEVPISLLSENFYAETEVAVSSWGNYNEDQVGLRIKNSNGSQNRITVLYGTSSGLAGIRYGIDGGTTVFKGDTCQAYTVNTIKNTPATKIKLAIAKLDGNLYYYENDVLMNKVADTSFTSETKAQAFVYSKGSVSSYTNIKASTTKSDVEAYVLSKEDSFDLASGNYLKAFNVSKGEVKSYNGLDPNNNYHVLNFRKAASDNFTASAKFKYGSNGDSSFANRRMGFALTDENNKHLYVLLQASSATAVDSVITYKTDSTSYTVTNWTAVAKKTGLTLSNENVLTISRDGKTLHVYVNDEPIYDVNLDGILSGNTKVGISTWKTDATISEYSIADGHLSMLTFDCNGIGSADPIIAMSGSAINLPTLESDGLTFNGWYSDAALTSKFEEGTMPSSDTKLYAKWSASIENTSTNINSLMIGNSSYSKFSIECDITPSAVANCWAQVGFTLKNSSSKNAYFYFGNGNKTGTMNFNNIYIDKDVQATKPNEQSAGLRGSSVPNTTGTNKFKLSVNNNQITMYVNGIEASSFEVTRHTYLSNDDTYKLGLMSKGTTVDFDNIKITSN